MAAKREQRKRVAPPGRGGRRKAPPPRLWGFLAAAALCALAIFFSRYTKPLKRHDGGKGQSSEEVQTDGLRKTACHVKSYSPAVDGCTPRPAGCGARVVDGLLSAEEVNGLTNIAERGMVMGGGAGGPTILDLHSGALSLEDKFIDVWMAFNVSKRKPYTRSDLAVYHKVTQRLALEVESTFGVSGIMLTSPTFFSRISADRPPRIANDEYWHTHIDKQQYGSFVYTVLLYLSEQGVDFEGGSLCFDSPKTKQVISRVAPRVGRTVLFTSGHEHPHHVEQVQ